MMNIAKKQLERDSFLFAKRGRHQINTIDVRRE
jgi:hypothetical protein